VLPGWWRSFGNVSDVWREAELPGLDPGEMDEAWDACVHQEGPWRGTKPRKERTPLDWQRSGVVTDSMTEQGLEADAPVRCSKEGRLWQRRRSEMPSGIGENGKGATATVTWCGCRRGESFEGCEIRRGEGIGTPDEAGFVQRRPGTR